MNRIAQILLIGALAISSAWAQSSPPLPNVAPHQSVGTVNCASSTCHGAVTPWQDSNVLQNEYTTWLRLDKHARAYSTLLNEQSQRIAKNLGLKEGAHKAKICLDCHAHNPAPSLRGERHIVAEGVGCEACHGPAEKWVKSHTVAGTLHADNIANGLYPTDQPVAQAKLCLSCHFGDENRFVTHRIMGAGHPRMSFELETFAALSPAHYRIDDDWKKRKGEFEPIKVWAIGQALAAQQLLNTLADPKRGRDGLFPELVLFDCHACHHPMSDKKWTARDGLPPGKVRLNDSNLLMLRALIKATDPARSAAFNAQVLKVHQAISGKGDDPLVEAKKLSAMISETVPRLEAMDFNQSHLQGVIRALIDEAQNGHYTDYAGAEQAYMAISSMASSLVKRGLAKPAPINKALADLRRTLANEENFSPRLFASELGKLRAIVLAGAK
ncbi:MAG: hypothetical protein RIR70_57 [Pseudomonadota bacterium]